MTISMMMHTFETWHQRSTLALCFSCFVFLHSSPSQLISPSSHIWLIARQWHFCPCQTVRHQTYWFNVKSPFSSRIWNWNKRSNICWCKFLQMFACSNIKVSLSTSETHLTLFGRGQVHSDKGKARQMKSLFNLKHTSNWFTYVPECGIFLDA